MKQKIKRFALPSAATLLLLSFSILFVVLNSKPVAATVAECYQGCADAYCDDYGDCMYEYGGCIDDCDNAQTTTTAAATTTTAAAATTTTTTTTTTIGCGNNPSGCDSTALDCDIGYGCDCNEECASGYCTLVGSVNACQPAPTTTTTTTTLPTGATCGLSEWKGTLTAGADSISGSTRSLTSGLEHWFRVYISGSLPTILTLTSPANQDFDAKVYSSSCTGSEVASCELSPSPETCSFTPLVNANYYIKVWPYVGSGIGTISIVMPTTPTTTTTTTLPCTGTLSLTLSPSTTSPDTAFTATAGGLSNCNGKVVAFFVKYTPGSAWTAPAPTSVCTVSGSGCSLVFTSSTDYGTDDYGAGIDKNNLNGYDDAGEWATATLSIPITTTTTTTTPISPAEAETAACNKEAVRRGYPQGKCYLIGVESSACTGYTAVDLIPDQPPCSGASVGCSACHNCLATPISDSITIGTCTITLKTKGCDSTDDSSCTGGGGIGYNSYNKDTADPPRWREIKMDDNVGDGCGENLYVKNSWAVSGTHLDILTITTVGDRLGSTTNQMKGGYDISASSGCFMTATIGSTGYFCNPSINGIWKTTNDQTATQAFNIDWCGDGECVCGETCTNCAADCGVCLTTTTTTTTTTTLPCTLSSVSITPNCAGGSSSSCEPSETISMSASYTGDCDTVSYFQIDAGSCPDANGDNICDNDAAKKVCAIQYSGGDMSGISSNAVMPSPGSFTGTWSIPAIHADCYGKTVNAYAAGLYDWGPPPTTGISFKGNAASPGSITGSFTFAECVANGAVDGNCPAARPYCSNNVCVECLIDTDCKGADGTYNTYCPKGGGARSHILPSCTANSCACEGSCVSSNANCAPGFCCTGETPQGPRESVVSSSCVSTGGARNPWLCA